MTGRRRSTAVTETCRCGASWSLQGRYPLDRVLGALEAWRAAHHCSIPSSQTRAMRDTLTNAVAAAASTRRAVVSVGVDTLTGYLEATR
jgi:hypothetical protein